jgi:hypothetical protein
VAESENVYVKIGERGLLIERVANTPRDHVNLKGTGWVLKGSKGAPTKKDETGTAPDPADTTPAATSVRAYAEEAEAAVPGAKKARLTSGSGSSRAAAGGSAKAADA